MDRNSPQDLVQGLDGEPELSLALVEPREQPLQIPLVDWDTLRIEESVDEEGRIEIVDEDVMYELLGLVRLDEESDKSRKAARNGCSQQKEDAWERTEEVDTNGAAIDVDDYVPGERILVHDPNRPSMDLGTVYPNMKEFRLAVRQFAINKEFALHIVKTDPSRYIGNCKAEDCPWHLVGRRQPDGCTVMVTKVIDEHTCTSSARRKTTTPSCAWVASKAIHHLRKKITMGPKELQQTIQDEQKCEIHYDTICRGRKVALVELFGNWEESFQMLFNWREEVLKRRMKLQEFPIGLLRLKQLRILNLSQNHLTTVPEVLLPGVYPTGDTLSEVWPWGGVFGRHDSSKRGSHGLKLESKMVESMRQRASHGTSVKSFNTIVMKFPKIDEGLRNCKTIFEQFDEDSNGEIDKEELKNCFQKLEISFAEEEISDLFEACDINEDMGMKFNEFIVFLCLVYLLNELAASEAKAKMGLGDLESTFETLVDAFVFLDKNKDGYVSKDEMIQAINESIPGERSSGRIAMKRFEEMDWDKNGMVNFKEFLFAFTRWVGIGENEDEDE